MTESKAERMERLLSLWNELSEVGQVECFDSTFTDEEGDERPGDEHGFKDSWQMFWEIYLLDDKYLENYLTEEPVR